MAITRRMNGPDLKIGLLLMATGVLHGRLLKDSLERLARAHTQKKKYIFLSFTSKKTYGTVIYRLQEKRNWLDLQLLGTCVVAREFNLGRCLEMRAVSLVLSLQAVERRWSLGGLAHPVHVCLAHALVATDRPTINL